MEDYYLYFRRYLHQLFAPLAYLIIGSSALIVISFPIFFRLNLVRPLDSLIEGVRQVNAGNLGVTMPVRYHDEIGFLTQSFNDTTAKLQRRTLALQHRAAELEALARVSSALREAVTLEDMTAILVEETVSVLEAEAGAVLLLEDEALVVAGLQGLPRTLLGHRLLPCDGPCWQTMDTGQPILSAPIEWRRRAACELAQTLAHGMTAIAVVPLQAGEETLGLLQIAFSQPGKSLEEHRRPLVAIAEMGGNALQRVKVLETLEQQVADRTRELSALYEVSAVASQAHSLETLLTESLSRTMEAMRSDAGAIYLLGEMEDAAEPLSLRLAVQQDIPAELLDQYGTLAADSGVFSWVMEHREPLLIPDVTADPRTGGMEPGDPMTLLLAPVLAEGQVLGVLGLVRELGQVYNTEEVALLASIADQVGVAVQSDRLRQRAQQATLLEERQRLARDLHDSVTQSLYGLVTLAEAGQARLEAGALDTIGTTFARIGETARQAVKEMRLFIHELRPAVLEQEGLAGALHLRLAAVEGQADVQARLLADEVSLPLPLAEALYQIAQEALNNTLKHAGAGRVTAYLKREGKHVILEIVDDGCGFDPETVSDSGGMGLTSMRARAEAVGGVLQVISAPGAGTRVRVTVISEQ